MKSGWVGGITNYAEATVNSGEQFAGFIEKGDVFAFIGELASGKTTFIKGILKGLEYKKSVTSPTFTLVNEYDAKFPVIHIDCYREDELERWIKLGMNDYLSEENVVIIEWADKMQSLLPDNTIQVHFSHNSINSREIMLSSL
jgi:tRNA threonylcarbamoyladenosine biosynthesis protein TsaE|tara:strand:- start:1675 stop:2103 length:429 start_codon:yes stop_codon:yes gene_type:complete